MSDSIEPAKAPETAITAAPQARDRARELLEAFLRGRNANTLDAYKRDLNNFAGFLGLLAPEEAVRVLLVQDGGGANALALKYQSWLVEQELSPATVNRRIAALRSMARLGRMLGLVAWHIEIDDLRSDPYRDTRGPGEMAIRAMLVQLRARGDAKALRDVALIRLMYDCGLRRGEVCALDRESWVPQKGLAIRGKGRREPQWITLPPNTLAALERWVRCRGDTPGPLFVALDEHHRGHRLTGSGLYAIVQRLGVAVGVRTHPHGFRHGAITSVLDKKGDVRMAQKFSRHRDLNTLMLYDDNRRDLAGEAAALISLPEEDGEMVAACGRGHVHEAGARAIGAFCTQGECFTEKGLKTEMRKIRWISAPPALAPTAPAPR